MANEEAITVADDRADRQRLAELSEQFYQAHSDILSARKHWQKRLEHHEKIVKRLSDDLDPIRVKVRSMPDHDRGWPIGFVVIVSLVAVALEWFPALLTARVYLEGEPQALFLLTASFAVMGAALGALLGHALRSFRLGNSPNLTHAFFALLIGVLALLYLRAVFLIRVGIPQSPDALVPQQTLAAGLVVLSAAGMAFACFATYHAEGFGLFLLRHEERLIKWRLARTQAAYRYGEVQSMRYRHECTEVARRFVAALPQTDDTRTTDYLVEYLLGDLTRRDG
jgi:hypothetical protein